MLDAFLAALGLTKGATIGGFFGALVSLRSLEGMNLWQGFCALLSGTLCAAYITPLVLVTANISLRTESAISFLIGWFGLALGAAVFKAIPDWANSLRKKVFGEKGGEA